MPIFDLLNNYKTKTMEKLKELFEKLESLKAAYKNGYLSTNEYSTNYTNIYKQIKRLTLNK
jgi:hypothetical protein